MTNPTEQPINTGNGNEWFIAVNTLPVKREEIVNGFLDKLGITAENGFIFGLLKSIGPLLPDSIFNTISETLFGGGANHTYISVCEVVDGKPVTREVLHAMGLEFNADGTPKLSAAGELIPVVVDENTFENDPLYAKWSTETTESIKILEGNKDTIYQGYSTMLDGANQVFDHAIKYDMTKENCNAFTAENLESIGAFDPNLTQLGAGMNKETFNSAAQASSLTGADLMARVEAQKQTLGQVLENHKETAPENTASLKNEITPTITSAP